MVNSNGIVDWTAADWELYNDDNHDDNNNNLSDHEMSTEL